MGQTVSLNSCVSGGSVVRVMRTDGDFETFDFPCSAAEVMMQHPGHLVVHCSPVDRNSIGQRSKITIMLPDNALLPGQPYMLYPIPESYKKSLARSKSFSILKKKFETTSTPTVSPAEKRQGRRKALKMIFTRLNLATFVANNINEPKDASTKLLENGPTEPAKATTTEQENEEGGENDTTRTVQLPNPADLSYGWRPRLSSIPESPLGFHSLPQSPLGLYKLDSFAPSPLSVGSHPLPAFVAAA